MAKKESSRAAEARPHVVLRLKKGWAYDAERRRFFHSESQAVHRPAGLPKYSRILLQVPSLAKLAKRSPSEDRLARGVQIVPPKGNPLREMLPQIRDWPCVEKVWLSPEIRPAKKKNSTASVGMAVAGGSSARSQRQRKRRG